MQMYTSMQLVDTLTMARQDMWKEDVPQIAAIPETVFPEATDLQQVSITAGKLSKLHQHLKDAIGSTSGEDSEVNHILAR